MQLKNRNSTIRGELDILVVPILLFEVLNIYCVNFLSLRPQLAAG